MAVLSMRRNGVSHFYHTDALGSTRQLTDVNQTVTDTYLYKAFGEEVAVTGTTVNPLRYVGAGNYYTDTQSGLKLLGMRFYVPRIGRFVTFDLKRDVRNWHVYVAGNPINSIDPSGTTTIGIATCFDKEGCGACQTTGITYEPPVDPKRCKQCPPVKCYRHIYLGNYPQPFAAVPEKKYGGSPFGCWDIVEVVLQKKKPGGGWQDDDKSVRAIIVSTGELPSGPNDPPGLKRIIDLRPTVAMQLYEGAPPTFSCKRFGNQHVVRVTRVGHEAPCCGPKICWSSNCHKRREDVDHRECQ